MDLLNLRFLDRDFFIENEEKVSEYFMDAANWRTVPILNYTPLCTLENAMLVRFRGVIKDMLDDETYLQQYEVTNQLTGKKRFQVGKYQDTLNLKPNETVDLRNSENVYQDRKVLYMIAIPSLNSWAFDFESDVNCDINNFPKNKNLNRFKRRASEFEELLPNEGNNDQQSKRFCPSIGGLNNEPQDATTSQSSSDFSAALNQAANPSCIVKLYTKLQSFLLNASIEVLGFISIPKTNNNPVDHLNPLENDIGVEELGSVNHVPYQAPMMHVIKIRKLNNLNPLLDMAITEIDSGFTTRIESIFNSIIFTLKHCLFGDELAAKYLVGHLISTIYVRSEFNTLGQFSINIFNIPNETRSPGYTKSLYELIELFVPASKYIPMTCENMNTLSLVPKKDHHTNKFETGVLQLADQSQLVLDETKLKTDNLELKGLHGLKVLSDLIHKQQIYYDFDSYKMAIQTNIPVLVLSKKRSKLSSNCRLRLKYDVETIPIILETLKAAKFFIRPKLNEIRKYLTSGKLMEFLISSELSEVIEHDFIKMRRADESIKSEYLHTLLVLSRLMGIANGKKSLDKVAWQMALDMEKERKLRLKRF